MNVYFENALEFGVFSEDGEKPAVCIIEALEKNLTYLRAQNAQGKHIFVRPLPAVSEHFILVDDLNRLQVERHFAKPGRLIVESSPANFQVWIHSESPLTLETKRYWLSKLGSDPGADPDKRWGRCPGFTNRKEKYKAKTGFPFAKLVMVDFATAKIPAAPLVQVPKLEKSAVAKRYSPETVSGRTGEQIARPDYDVGDESITDFRYSMALFKRGFSDDEIMSQLLHERQDWSHHQGGHRLSNYLERTIRKARSWVK